MMRYVAMTVTMIGAFAGMSALLGGLSRAYWKKRVDHDADEAMAILRKAGIVGEDQ